MNDFDGAVWFLVLAGREALRRSSQRYAGTRSLIAGQAKLPCKLVRRRWASHAGPPLPRRDTDDRRRGSWYFPDPKCRRRGLFMLNRCSLYSTRFGAMVL